MPLSPPTHPLTHPPAHTPVYVMTRCQVNTVFSEDTQRGTDRLVRIVLQVCMYAGSKFSREDTIQCLFVTLQVCT